MDFLVHSKKGRFTCLDNFKEIRKNRTFLFYDFRAETARLLAKLPPPAREIEFTAVKSGPY